MAIQYLNGINVSGDVGIGTDSPYKTLDVQGEAVISQNLWIGPVGGNDAANSLEIGRGRTGNGICFIDMTTDNTTYTDYGFRLIRYSGINSNTELIHRGTGDFRIKGQEASNMRFYTGNSARMSITSTGNVGIGTTSPGAKLDVNGAIVSRGGSYSVTNDSTTNAAIVVPQNNQIYCETSGGYLRNLIYMDNSGNIRVGQTGTGLINDMYLSTGNSGIIRFETKGSESMRINTIGNVGIGTTSPVGKLSVYRTDTTYAVNLSDARSRSSLYLKGSGNYDSELTFSSGQSNVQLIQAVNSAATSGRDIAINPFGGDVGIGTTGPSEKLVVRGGNYAGNQDGGIAVQMGDEAGSHWKSAVKIKSNSSGIPRTVIETTTGQTSGQTNDAIQIDTAGKVGIGTDSPSVKLQVDGTVKSSGLDVDGQANSSTNFLQYTRTDSTQPASISYDGTGGFDFNLNGGTVKFSDANSGSVGIGGSIQSGFKLDISGSSVTRGNVYLEENLLHFGSSDFSIKAGGTNNMTFSTNNSERMRINSSGNVGIGTTSPGYNLDVTGTARITNNVWLGSNIYHDNDGNSAYIGFPSDDTWRVVTSGSERLRVNSSGNVGIGVTSPSYELDVNGTVDATSFRAGGVSKYTTYNSTNTYENYGTTISNMASSPVGYLYHDLLAFNYNYTVTQEVSTDGTNFSSETLDKRLFNQKQDQAITVVSSSEYAVRWTVQGTAWNNAKFINLAFTYTNPHPQTRVIIESSTDGTTWTSRHDSTASGVTGTKSCYVGNWSGDNYVRITISKTSSNTNVIKLSSIKMMTARAGDQGDGMELQYPYVWDEDRNIGLLLTKSDTPTSKLDVLGATNTSNSSLLRLRSTSTSPNAPEKVASFHYNTNTERGYIAVNQYSVTYSTSSDYRLKENVEPISNGIERLKELNPCRFNFIGDNYTVDGFLAHETAEVVPESVTGEKDAINENNEPIYQGIDQSKIVPLLTAALKEAIEKIEQLETRIQTLENN